MKDKSTPKMAARNGLLVALVVALSHFCLPALAHDEDPHVCGNGVREAEEECDDGNLVGSDGCEFDCTVGVCEGPSYETTFEAIQDVIFEGYGCTNGACHGPVDPRAGLNFQSETLYSDLVGRPSNTYPPLDRIARLDPETSLLYMKVAARTDDTELDPNLAGVMPPTGSGPPALSPAHLLTLYRWIRNGAPESGVVEGTQHLLEACLPEPEPITIPDVSPPAHHAGIQWRSTPMPAPAESESETCMVTFYDFTQTDLVPQEAISPCPSSLATLSACVDPLDSCDPDDSECVSQIDLASITDFECRSDAECDEGHVCTFSRGANNPSGLCFAYNRISVAQDSLSHHFILNVYAGRYGPEHEAWGAFARRFRDTESEEQGTPCDPTEIDFALGYNPGCSSEPIECIAGISYGPSDYGNFLSFFGDDSAAPRLILTQEPFIDFEFHEDTYGMLPMAGILNHNSHRFNLTSKDATLEAFINLRFAGQQEQEHEVHPLFDASAIWVQNVPPYQTREYCNSVTLPRGTRLFHLTSHQHRTGTQFRIWGPPIDPCRADCSAAPGLGSAICTGFQDMNLPLCTPGEEEPIYFSTDYQDPKQLWFPEPLELDQEAPADRTFLYCGVFDNGSTPESPAVKRQSISPWPPVVETSGVAATLRNVGGPCADDVVECIADPQSPADPNLGVRCGGDDTQCLEFNGRSASCDACPVTGGLTTGDEMFIVLGEYFLVEEVPEPGGVVSVLAVLATLSMLRRRRRRAG